MLKRCVLLFAMLVIVFTGCGEEEKQIEWEAVEYTGFLNSYTIEDDSVVFTIEMEDFSLKTLTAGQDTVNITDYVPGDEVRVYCQKAVDESDEYVTAMESYGGYVDTSSEYDGYILLGTECNMLYQSSVCKVDIRYVIDRAGRLYTGSVYDSYYVKQDEKFLYINIIGKSSFVDTNSSWSSMEYVDRVNKDSYYQYNYGGWTHSRSAEVSTVHHALSDDSVNVESVTQEGAYIIVSGECGVDADTYALYLVRKVFKELGCDVNGTDLSVTFTAKFMYDTSYLDYIIYTVTSDSPVPCKDGSLMLDSFTVAVTVVDLNDTLTVSIPDYVKVD